MRTNKEGATGAAAPDWSAILVEAVQKPGIISSAYTAFWNYSPGNQLLAWLQCVQRKIQPGPLHTFRGWRRLGRHVRRGERALTLCMPVTMVKRRDPRTEEIVVGDGAERPAKVVTQIRYLYRPNWFTLAQTDGTEYVPMQMPSWSEFEALARLNVERVRFEHLNGNVQGYASGRKIAVSPIAFLAHRTLFHELAHVICGHTEELQGLSDGQEVTPRDIREVEAECVALICCESLGLSGTEFSRGYIQHWLSGQPIPERSAHRIFKVADSILRAGYSANSVVAIDDSEK